MLLAALGEPVIRKYHVSRIGRVKADNVFGKYAWLTGAACRLFSIVDSNFRGQGVPSVAILVWAIVPIRDVVGGWPYRNYHIVNVVSLLLGSLLHVSVRSQDDGGVVRSARDDLGHRPRDYRIPRSSIVVERDAGKARNRGDCG